MEAFKPPQIVASNYRSIYKQYGGTDMDLYIYNQDGEGLGSFFGKLARMAMPMLGNAIKGSARIASPHIKRAASEIITAGSKSAINKLSDKRVHKPHTRKRKWRNL